MMKNTHILSGLLLATCTMGTASASDNADGMDPFVLYGDRIIFDVIRDGETVGEHTVRFRRDGGAIIADSKFSLTIRIFTIPVYTYNYSSQGRWQDGRLVQLNAKTDDNGDVSKVTVQPSGNTYQVNDVVTRSKDIFPTTHWNSGVIGATSVINTITGEVNAVTMSAIGTEQVTTGDTKRDATHYAYRGDLRTEVWYDGLGRWVKMRFPGKDGTMIEYRCRICGIENGNRAAAGNDGQLANGERTQRAND